MFFQEYAITPEVFSKEYSKKDPLREKEILFFLRQLDSIQVCKQTP